MTSNPELLPLIYRHLKENGFQTAADELQKLSPQGEAPTASTTLLDIYSAWLKSAKRRKKPATPKPSTSVQKQTPKKAAQRKKTDLSTEPRSTPASTNKKSTPTKRKKADEKSPAKVVKSNNAGTAAAAATGGEDSDSDSSLDVEKWKKRFQEMTDNDFEKLAAFNALVTPEPKKTRARKPRVKANPNPETPNNVPSQPSEPSDKSATETSSKSNSAKKSRPRKVAPAAAIKVQNGENPAASAITPSKQSSKKEKRKASDQASSEPKQKKKKQTIQNDAMKEHELIKENNNESIQITPPNLPIESAVASGDDKIMNNKDTKMIIEVELKDVSQENTPSLHTESKKKKKKSAAENNVIAVASGDELLDKSINQTEPKKKKKKSADQSNVITGAGGDELVDKSVTNTKDDEVVSQAELKDEGQENASNPHSESKKKKKKKANDEIADSDMLVTNNSKATGEDLNGVLPSQDLSTSLITPTAETDSVVKVKKKKKKKDKSDDGEALAEANGTVSNEIPCEKTVEESSPNTEVSKKKKKKKDKDKEEPETLQQIDMTVNDEEVCAENTEQVVVKKKSKKKKKESEVQVELEDKTAKAECVEIPEECPLPPAAPQTPGSKKKKHKLDSEKEIEDAVPLTQESETPKKKKKKASKSKEAES